MDEGLKLSLRVTPGDVAEIDRAREVLRAREPGLSLKRGTVVLVAMRRGLDLMLRARGPQERPEDPSEGPGQGEAP